jgi:NAD(P)-dependent dehydrogenase (short-subunit alcohol dehydrogenase family)
LPWVCIQPLYLLINGADIETSFVDTPIIKEQIESGSMDAQFQMTPIGRPAQVEEISDSLLFLCSSSSSYMCGAALVVDGGFTV